MNGAPNETRKEWEFVSKNEINNSLKNANLLVDQIILEYIYIYIYMCVCIRSAFNKAPEFFVQAFKIVVDSWKFSMLLLYILWDDWPIFMISG